MFGSTQEVHQIRRMLKLRRGDLLLNLPTHIETPTFDHWRPLGELAKGARLTSKHVRHVKPACNNGDGAAARPVGSTDSNLELSKFSS